MENIIFDNIKVFSFISLEKSNELLNFFNENDYVLLNNVLTDEIKIYLKENILFTKKNALNDARQFFREHNDEEASDFIKRFFVAIHPFYEFVLKKELTKIIGFCMKYNENSDCKPHYDNYNMPISSTICFYNEDKITYPLYIDKSYLNNPHPFRLTVDDKVGIPEENKIKIDINEGDIGIFRGRNHLHWRDKLPVKDYRALLCHTEDYKYDNKLISYIFNDNCTKANINNVKNINTYSLTDLNNYQQFRKDYVMYFNNK
jgi:hypothetical protein